MKGRTLDWLKYTNFEIGDEVHSLVCGYGKVVGIHNSHDYPILVRFHTPINRQRYFSFDVNGYEHSKSTHYITLIHE